MERSIADVLANRRFELSVFQQPERSARGFALGEGRDLWARIDNTAQLDDLPLSLLGVNVAPYDHSCNIKKPVVVKKEDKEKEKGKGRT